MAFWKEQDTPLKMAQKWPERGGKEALGVLWCLVSGTGWRVPTHGFEPTSGVQGWSTWGFLISFPGCGAEGVRER